MQNFQGPLGEKLGYCTSLDCSYKLMKCLQHDVSAIWLEEKINATGDRPVILLLKDRVLCTQNEPNIFLNLIRTIPVDAAPRSL